MKLLNKLFIISVLSLSMSLVGCDIVDGIKNLVQPKGYSLIEYNNGDLVIEMQTPLYTVGVGGFNKVSIDWHDVKVDNLINDIYNFFQRDRKYSTYSLWVKFVSDKTDKYGNTTKEYENHFLTKISVAEARKYQSASYFNQAYQIPAKIIDARNSNVILMEL